MSTDERTHLIQHDTAGQQIDRALGAAWLGGIRPASITVELTSGGTPASLIIDAEWGTTREDTRRVFQALGITDPELIDWPEPGGRTRVDVDDSRDLGDHTGYLGLPVSITVDGPTLDHTASPSPAEIPVREREQTADVVDLATYRTHHDLDHARAHRAAPAAADEAATADESVAEDDVAAEDDDGSGL